MKMIDGGVSYYHCSGEWYRQVGGEYRAVAQP
jgi:YHS domain-containing protein